MYINIYIYIYRHTYIYIYMLCVCSISIYIDHKRQQNHAVRFEKTASFSIFTRTTSTKSRKSSLATPCITEDFAASGQSKIERCNQWMISMLMFDDVLCWCFMIMFNDAWWWHSSSTVVRYEYFATIFCLSQSEEAFFSPCFLVGLKFPPSFQSGQCRSVQTKLHWYSPVTDRPKAPIFHGWSWTFEAPPSDKRTTKLNLSENFEDSIPVFIYRIFWKVQLYEGHKHQRSYWNMSPYFRMALKCSLQSELHVSYIFTAFNSATIPSWGPHSSVRSKDPLIASILELIENLRSSQGCFWVVSFGTWFSSSTGHISTIHVFKWTLSFDKF